MECNPCNLAHHVPYVTSMEHSGAFFESGDNLFGDVDVLNGTELGHFFDAMLAGCDGAAGAVQHGVNGDIDWHSVRFWYTKEIQFRRGRMARLFVRLYD
eukprot:1686695-Rhodomonas_salina.3